MTTWILLMIILTPTGEVRIMEEVDSRHECNQRYQDHMSSKPSHERLQYAQCVPTDIKQQSLTWEF